MGNYSTKRLIISNRKDIIIKSLIRISLIKELGILTNKYDYYFNNKLETSIDDICLIPQYDRKCFVYWFDDNNLLIIKGCVLYKLDLKTKEKKFLYRHDSYILSVKVLPNHRIISCDCSSIIVFDIIFPNKIQITKEDDLQNITIFNNWIVCHLSREIQIWDLEDYTCKYILRPSKVKQYQINTVVVFDKKIACDCGLFIKVWDFNIKKLDYTKSDIHLQGHTEQITVICPLPNNKIISGSYDKNLRLWNLTTQECEHVFSDHCDDIYSILPLSGNRCISADSSGIVIIWDLNTCYGGYIKPSKIYCEKNMYKINIIHHEISGQILCWSKNYNYIPINNSKLKNLCVLNPDTGKIDKAITDNQFIYSVFVNIKGKVGVRFKDKIEIYS